MPIRELTPAEMPLVYPLVAQLNPGMDKKVFRELLDMMLARGYRCMGAWEKETLAGICGFWITAQFFSGKQVELDNLIVLPEFRGKKLGQKLTRSVEKLAVREGCRMVFLKTYTSNFASHRFYFREGYHILGYGFVKEIA